MKRSLTLHYSIHHLLYWSAAAGVVSFASTYLLGKGFPASQVGVIMAASGLLSCISQPFIAAFADRARKNILPGMMVLLAAVCALCFGSVAILPLPKPVFGLLFLVGSWAFDVMIPLMNSIQVQFSGAGYSVNYGAARGMGSLCYSFTALAMGNVIAMFGVDSMMLAVLVFLCMMAVVVLRYPKVEKQGNAVQEIRSEEAHTSCCTVGTFFLRYRWYCVSLLGITMLAMFHIMVENYMIKIMERLGGNSSNVGTALFISSCSSVIIFFLFSRIRAHISDQWLLKTAGLCYVLKSVLFLMAPNFYWIYGAQLLQMTTYAFLSPVQVYYARQKVAPSDMVKGQAFITAFYALGCSMGNLLGGTLVENFGVETLLTAGVGMAVSGTVILFLTVHRTDLPRPMSYITTFTGKHFDPTEPDMARVDIRDIAHALSLTCRGNGHVKTFFSVGQHCVNCAREARARGYSDRVVLACLIHDASEAYMSDVPRPFKKSLPEYRQAEERLLGMIYRKFLGSDLTEEEKTLVKRIDDDLLYYDLKELLNEISEGPAPELKISLDYQVVPFEAVEEEYLRLFYASGIAESAQNCIASEKE